MNSKFNQAIALLHRVYPHTSVLRIGENKWKSDYFKFCELLGLEPGEYADEQYRYFQHLAESLTRFNTECLAKMIDAGVEK